MLAEGFLSVLCYSEERPLASAAKRTPHARRADQFNHHLSDSDSNPADLQTDPSKAGPNQMELDSVRCQGLKVAPEGPEGSAGRLIPGGLTLDPDFIVCLDNCSLLEQYSDLQVATIPQPALYTPVPESCRQPEWAAHHWPRGEPVSIPDQGYLAMGPSVNNSLDLPGSGLGPMSNSVLNGLLEKQLEEVYMQHLTDNLARCNSHLGNSLLHGLVPPPQPGRGQPRGPDSLEAASLDPDSGGGDAGKRISYLSTQILGPCSSNFSSPVLRISEAEDTHQK